MEFKNLDKTAFHWFATKEIKSLDEMKDNLPYLQQFTFAPFVPYSIYHFMRNGWDFLMLNIGVGIFAGIAQIILRIMKVIAGAQTLRAISSLQELGPRITQNQIDTFKNMKVSGEITSLSNPYFVTFLWITVVLFIAVKIYECIYARRLSWNRNEWKDLDTFKKSETLWNVAGIVCFTIGLCIIPLLFRLIKLIK